MKKALAIFVTVCIIASLFVACDNTTKLDELVSTRFDAAGSRSLIVSNENFIDINDDSLTWQYKAAKDTDPKYNVGASSAWKTIPANGSDEGKLDNTIEFSQGKWNFELRAVKTTDTTSVVIYYGKTEAPVLLQKQTSTNPQSIVINLTAQLSGQKGFIVLSGIGIKHNADDTSTFDVPDEVKIGTRVLIKDTDYTVSGNTISTDDEGLAFDVGTYTITVKKTGANGEILAMEEKTVEVYAGLKTTISNWILEITQAGQFAPVAPTGTTSGNVSNADSAGNLALTVENVTPSMVSGKDTTVTVPTSVLGSSATTATVSVAVKQASEASSDNSFTASTGKSVAAVVDLTLSAGSNPVTDFSSPVKVETYVAKNLAGFSFGYPGETWTKKDSLNAVAVAKDYYYDSTEGKLTFLTDHFSSFVVETSSEAVIGNVAYDTFTDAKDNVKEGETIVLLKDSTFTGTQLYRFLNFTINLNGNSLDASESTLFAPGYTLSITDSSARQGTISINCISTYNSGTMRFENVEVNAQYGTVFKNGHLYVTDCNFTVEQYIQAQQTGEIEFRNSTCIIKDSLSLYYDSKNIGTNKLTIDNCTFSGFYTVNGTTPESANCVVTITNSIYVPNTQSEDNMLYFAGYADYIIENNQFNVSGDSPLYFKAGKVRISGNTFNCECNDTYAWDYIYYGNGAFSIPSIILIDECPGYQGFREGVIVENNTFNLSGTQRDNYWYLAYNLIPESTQTASVTHDIEEGKFLTSNSYQYYRGDIEFTYVNGDSTRRGAAKAYFNTIEKANSFSEDIFEEAFGHECNVTNFGEVFVIQKAVSVGLWDVNDGSITEIGSFNSIADAITKLNEYTLSAEQPGLIKLNKSVTEDIDTIKCYQVLIATDENTYTGTITNPDEAQAMLLRGDTSNCNTTDENLSATDFSGKIAFTSNFLDSFNTPSWWSDVNWE